MKVAIDGTALNSHTGGTETYVRNIISGLGTVDPHGDYTLLLDKPLPQNSIPSAENMRRVIVRTHYQPISIPFWRNGLTAVQWYPPTAEQALALLRERIDVLHVTITAPLFVPARIVVTVHDIAFERYPQFYPPDFVARLRVMVPLAIRRAAIVLTLSEFSKQHIVRRYSVPSEKIVVVPCAAGSMYQPIYDEARLAAVRKRYGTSEHFILYVGDLQPRKNLKTLVTAYTRLRQTDTIRHKLVLVGRKGWLYDELFTVMRASGYIDDLVLTDYVPDEDLVALYNAANLLVYPSIFEGFGIPPLEAMACGTPVVTSTTSSLPEVVGDAAITVDPLDAEAMAQAIAQVLNNRALRAELIARGLRRASLFSWEETARTIQSVYQRVARGQHRASLP